MDRQYELQAIADAINDLPPLCRRAFILIRYERKSFKEAGEILSLPPKQVYVLVYRALAQVQGRVTPANQTDLPTS